MNSTGSISGRLDRSGTLWVNGTGTLDRVWWQLPKPLKQVKKLVILGSIREIGKSAIIL